MGAGLTEILAAAGGPTDGVRAMLVGGYHGSWLNGGDAAAANLSQASLSAYGARIGAGVLVVLPDYACGLIESARVVRYLADQSAGQCGPCLFGLADIATAVESLSRGDDVRIQLASLRRWLAMVDKRGACSHPDGSVRFIRSSLLTFDAEVRRHEGGHCRAGGRAFDVLPT